MLGLCFCARAFSSSGEQGLLFIAVRGPLTITASLVAEHRLQTRRLSSCGSRAQLLRGIWDLPRPGLEPVSPALAGRFSTTTPPGKPQLFIFTPALLRCTLHTVKFICYKCTTQLLLVNVRHCATITAMQTQNISIHPRRSPRCLFEASARPALSCC